VVKSLNQSCQLDTRRKRRGAELPSQQGSNKEPVSNNRMEGGALEPPINDKELFDDVDPVSSRVPIGCGATNESVDNKKPEERAVVNSIDNEEPPISALEDRLVVDSVDDEELVHNNEPVPSPVPVGQGSEVRADDEFVNNEELVYYAAGNSANDEDPPISHAFKEGLFVDSVNDEESVRNNEPVASLAPIGRASKERVDDDSVNDEELVDYELPVAPQDNEGSVASVERAVVNFVVNKELIDNEQASPGMFLWTCPSPFYLSLTNIAFSVFCR
jgi:hypothetical protein